MKLYERLPDGVTVNGRFYRCDFDFRNVLKMLDVMQRDDIVPDARDYLCAKCVCKPPKNAGELYKALCGLLFGKDADHGGKRLTSFEQDAPLIRAAFRQVYGIDLFRDKLTWFEFTELLHGLPDGNRYEDVIGIRARPVPAPTKYNAKEREWLLQAKQRCALHLTETEAARKYEADVGKVFAGLLAMIPVKEVGTDGE
jgi:hypothetical protein